MALSQNRRRITFTSPLGANAFICTNFHGRERISTPFHFALSLVSENDTVAAADLVGKAVSWTVNLPEESPRPFNGFVRKLIAGPDTDRGLRHYQIEVVPWLWFLTRTTDCRIFQNMTIDAIITDTFDRFGLTNYKKQLQGTYPTREFCVQYRETAFAFVSRLMEEYGIFYYFGFSPGNHTLVMADTPAAYFDCTQSAVDYRPDEPLAEAVSSWDRVYEFRSGKLTHTDYNFITPSTNLLKSTATTISLTGIAKFELFDYPGGYPVAGEGQILSKTRMEEVEATFDTAAGASRCSSFTPGGKFTLQNHPVDNGSYVFVEVEHSVTEEWVAGGMSGHADYRNTFLVAPAAVPFRPMPTTPRPHIAGAQTAVVVGPSGEEIYTDQYGRVKVQFFWDRVGQKNENSSCWIRVSEMWAGKQWGMVFTPRIGQEVVVEFLEGDPDRPLITGRVYNAEQMPPYALPAKMTQSGVKTRSTKGGGEADFNELRFEDLKGNEDIYFHAQKDFHRFVEYDDDLQVLHDQTITIKNNRTLTVQQGFEHITIEQGNRERTVSQGNDKLTVTTGTRTVTVKSDYTMTVQEGNRSVTVSTGNDTHTVSTGNREVKVSTGNDTHTVSTGNREVKVSTGNDTHTVALGNINVKATAGAIVIEAGTSITLKVGANKIVIDNSGVVIDAMKVTLKAFASSTEVSPVGVTVKGPIVSLTGDMEAKLAALTVQVVGAAMTQVRGGLVKIN